MWWWTWNWHLQLWKEIGESLSIAVQNNYQCVRVEKANTAKHHQGRYWDQDRVILLYKISVHLHKNLLEYYSSDFHLSRMSGVREDAGKDLQNYERDRAPAF